MKTDIPDDVVFTIGNILYSNSFVQKALLETKRTRDDLVRLAGQHDGIQLLDDKHVLLTGKEAFCSFESEFGQYVREASFHDTDPYTNGKQTLGGCPIRCFASLRGREITFLHLYHRNCAEAYLEENFKIDSRSADLSNSESIMVKPSKGKKFPGDVSTPSTGIFDRDNGSSLSIQLTDCSSRKMSLRLNADEVTDSDFYKMICELSDWCWNIAPISLIDFQ